MRLELRYGLGSLASIAKVVPLGGLFLNVIGIIKSFKGIVGQQPDFPGEMLNSLSEALRPTAYGLWLGIIPFGLAVILRLGWK